MAYTVNPETDCDLVLEDYNALDRDKAAKLKHPFVERMSSLIKSNNENQT
jgi:hypothetical protein